MPSAGISAMLPLVVGHYTQHFAEGATGFFQTDIGLLNASEETANVTATFFPENLPSFALTFRLDPLARRTLDVNAILASQGITAAVSSMIESDQPLAATRQMTWGTPVYGSTLESGTPDASTGWYFAESAASMFNLYFLVQNPNDDSVTVRFDHLVEEGAPVGREVTIEPRAPRTFNVNEVSGLEAAALSTTVSANHPIVVERAMYITGTSRIFEAGTSSAGATTLGTTWNFAEGATNFFYTYLLLGNPNPAEASVTVVYQLPDGTTISRTHTVPARS